MEKLKITVKQLPPEKWKSILIKLEVLTALLLEYIYIEKTL